MNRAMMAAWMAVILTALRPFPAQGQIDPERRQLIQFGFNQPIEGRGPFSGYLFYYRNEPEFIHTNLTLRLAVAPVYVDSELGIRNALGANTDIGIGLAGGGFADSYSEVRRGKLIDAESFLGHGGEISASIYHLFNPNQLIPLNAILRFSPHFSTYQGDTKTSSSFHTPSDRTSFNVRTGLRWGGKEPTMWPDLGMELSAWYEGQFRSDSEVYGYGDRRVEPNSHLFWARALLIYTLPHTGHNFSFNLTTGTSIDADRFSSYRLGGYLPLVSEFPLSLPGYYFQEISARRFVLFSAQYSMPLDSRGRFNLTTVGTIANVGYVHGLEQAGNVHSGVGAGLRYRPGDTWQMVVGYSYGFDAIRQHGRGAQSIGILFQWDFEAKNRPHSPYFDTEGPQRSRGFFQFFGQ